jgi:hypothetical protein
MEHFRKYWRTDVIFQHLLKQHGEKRQESDVSDVAAGENFFEVSTNDMA